MLPSQNSSSFASSFFFQKKIHENLLYLIFPISKDSEFAFAINKLKYLLKYYIKFNLELTNTES